jgi:glycosyltransferase involved in cell wall biosynthesis
VAEALACSVPVLISNKVNIWREVEADGAGLVEPDTVEGATALIKRFLDLSPEEISQMRQNARTSFDARFKTEVFAQRLVDLIGSMV